MKLFPKTAIALFMTSGFISLAHGAAQEQNPTPSSVGYTSPLNSANISDQQEGRTPLSPQTSVQEVPEITPSVPNLTTDATVPQEEEKTIAEKLEELVTSTTTLRATSPLPPAPTTPEEIETATEEVESSTSEERNPVLTQPLSTETTGEEGHPLTLVLKKSPNQEIVSSEEETQKPHAGENTIIEPAEVTIVKESNSSDDE